MTREICDRYITQRPTDDGLVRVVIQMLPEEAAKLMKAVEAAGDRTSRDRARSTPVDALVEVADAFLAGGDVSAEAPVRATVEVVLHVHDDGSAQLDDGSPLSFETARRLSCDAAAVQITETLDGEVLSVGRRTRTIPASIRRALRARDGGCRFPGCTNRRYVDGHHIRHWADGGETKLSNLVELCRRHHRYVHEYGFSLELSDDDEIVFRDQHGQMISLAPLVPWTPAPLAEAPIPPTWDGSPLDYGWAIEGLLACDARDVQ
jgi:hypothetical protein